MRSEVGDPDDVQGMLGVKVKSVSFTTTAMTSTSSAPPYYVLASHNTLQSSTSAQASSILAHVDIQYRHADDSLLSLLPSHPDEHVFVLYHDPGNPAAPTIKSTSSQFALSGVKVSQAPGANMDTDKNPNMYVLQNRHRHIYRTLRHWLHVSSKGTMPFAVSWSIRGRGEPKSCTPRLSSTPPRRC
ncbi:hypothetical protein EDC04DRAFT_2778826 [Pisolithus marmoratus]|nr:hypothetical protein EDC04DRAFT_2778826 [Pisolithus marmoratus]